MASMHPITFIKMHGLGNDFVVLDSRGGPAITTPALARALGDRNRGVGFDQLAEIRDSDSADYALEFWNTDGSRAGACGNASRCVASLMLEGRDAVRFTTERGLLHAKRAEGGMIAVNMGHPQLDWAEVPLAGPTDTAHLPIEGDPAAVGMGNPHCIFFVPDAEAVDLAALGPGLEHHPLFPARTNVEFASLAGPDHLRMRVWERGAGVTLACGSGTCATAVAAHLRGLTGRRVTVDVDGGRLTIDWREDGVWMTGPVARVFDATLSPDWLEAV
ncbi:diaminopimelate epimerase [Falsirhodobacter algicola]|uniref:Diaminopimelate epimerase n=1 Tax=Falsirhodobacter algicola TaxID=2692330 RepID=A0A8J8MUC4_9RHOB|nr:diaminopimelate epimerase [Falsirhodobacter algicola]QUS36458.1 diaminopimelate epimerase [Falsirhodobacter algicola]